MSPDTSTTRIQTGDAARAAILIVHGGEPNAHVRWLSFCLDRIARVTPREDYHLFIWNDRPGDTWVTELVARLSNATLLTVSATDPTDFPNESFLHADRQQRLYDRARSAGFRVIVTMDSDAHPLRQGWLDRLRGALAGGAALAGVWHDEQRDIADPFVHPCCLATTVDFIESHGLRFNEIGANRSGRVTDTLCHFTACALENSREIARLRRSNRNQFHPIMGGVYGDLIYHHGGGSRRKLRYLGQLGLDEDRIIRQNLLLSGRASQALVQDYDRYLSWLTGREPADGATVRPSLVFVLGMHRSGTSCLMGALEACGCYLGDVDRADPFNPGGNLELPGVTRIHDRILADNGGTWDSPPATVRIQSWHRDVICDLLASFRGEGIGAVKDPRLLLTADAWLPVAGVCSVIGTFRHPLAVARSLARRNGIPKEGALRLWCAYNSRLVQLHERFQFPLVEFQFDSPTRYREELEAVLRSLGFRNDRAGLDAWIKQAEYSPDFEEDDVPKHCRVLLEYLRQHSIGVAAASSSTAKSPRSLVFAPDPDVLQTASLQSLRRLIYQFLYRVSLAYHHLPLGFRVWVRKVLSRMYAQKNHQASPVPEVQVKNKATVSSPRDADRDAGRSSTRGPGESA